MATYTCKGCKPIDASIIDAYVALIGATENANNSAANAEVATTAANNAASSANNAATQATNAANSATAAAAAANAAGITQAEASVDSNTGTPSVDVSLVNKKLSLSFHNIKGEKGDKGDRGDGAVLVINDLVTGGTDAALSAEMGKTLNNTKQATLVSGTNIKTVNGESLLGGGNIIAGDPNAVKYVEQTLTDAQKTQARTNIDAYQKPSTGIPATDLASAAQTSLGKADTAYQKPSAGIPKLDLESGVQASLDLADSAIQARPMGEVDPTITPADYATKEELDELEAKVTDLDAIQNDLVTVTGLQRSTPNLFDAQTATKAGILVSNGTVALAAPTIQTYLLQVIPGKKVTVDQKNYGNRFAIWSFSSYPQVGDTPTQTVSNNSASTLSITLGNTENYILIYINYGTPDASVADLRVFYGTTFVSAPTTTLITAFDATALVNTEKFRRGYELTGSGIVDFPVAFKNGQTWIFENKMSTSYQVALYKDAAKSVAGRLIIGLNAEATNEVVLTDDYVIFSTYSGAEIKLVIHSPEGAISGVVEPIWEDKQESIPELMFDAMVDTVYTGFTQKNGITNTTDDRYFRSDFIPVLPNHKYRLTVDGFVAEYNSSKSVISSGGYQGQGALTDYTFITTANTYYVILSARVNGAYIANKGFFKFYDMSPTYTISQDVLKALPMNGKRVLVFGDSIVGNIRAGWPLMLQDKTGAIVYNCGFGGCRMEYVNGPDSAPTNPFAMCELVDAMQNKVYLSQDMSTLASADTIRASLNQLKTITGAKSVVRLTVGTGVTADGNLTISLGGEDFQVAVTTAASTAASVAELIAAVAFDGWTVSADGAVVTFIKETIGVVADSPAYNAGSTGVSGTIQEVSAGSEEEVGMDNINVILIAYGTNELGYPQDDPNNPYNKETYAGATRYSLEKLCTNYKGVGIMLLTPIYRYAFGVPTTEDSDTYTHPIYGGKLTDNVETLKEVAQEYKVPCIDMYYQLGINKVNRGVYYIDGTHLNYVGLQRYSGFVAQGVEKYQ